MRNAILSVSSSLPEVVAAETALIDKLPSLLPDAIFLVNGQKMTTAQAVEVLKAHVTTCTELQTEHDRLHSIVVRQKLARALSRAVVEVLMAYTETNHGKASDLYRELGFAPATRRVPSAQTKATAVAKMNATRSARHIMGKRQRAAIQASPPVNDASAAPPPSPVQQTQPAPAPTVVAPNASVH